jgi:hypothetical protein
MKDICCFLLSLQSMDAQAFVDFGGGNTGGIIV